MTVRKDSSKLTVAFRYDPEFVERIKTIPDHRWNPKEKHWIFKNSDGTLEKILKAFEGEEIHVDPALQSKLPSHVIARNKATKQSQDNPSLAKSVRLATERGEGRFSDKIGIYETGSSTTP